MMNKKSPGIRCTECGATLDRNEYYAHVCDCEKITAEKRTAEQLAKTRRIVEHNLRVMEEAEKEWQYA